MSYFPSLMPNVSIVRFLLFCCHLAEWFYGGHDDNLICPISEWSMMKKCHTRCVSLPVFWRVNFNEHILSSDITGHHVIPSYWISKIVNRFQWQHVIGYGKLLNCLSVAGINYKTFLSRNKLEISVQNETVRVELYGIVDFMKSYSTACCQFIWTDDKWDWRKFSLASYLGN